MNIFIVILLAIIAYFISAILHELGHIFAGLILGFEFVMLVVGPIGLKRDVDRKIKLYFERNVALWGGAGGTIPKNLKNPEKILDIFAKILLAGPLFSIVFGIIILPVGILLKSLFLVFLGTMPLGMGVACLIPLRAGAFYTDGGRWRRIHRPETRDIEMAICMIAFSVGIGDDYSKADESYILILINSNDIITQYLGRYFYCCYFRDTKQPDKFEEEKNKLLAISKSVPSAIKSMYNLD